MKHTIPQPDHLQTLAHAIITRGPKVAVCSWLSDREAAEWTKAAQYALDGDTEDLEYLERQEELWERYFEYADQFCGHAPMEFEEWSEHHG